jgi:hypothetical protein
MASARQSAQTRKHRIGELSSAAVHEHLTVACRPYQDITAGAGEHHETLAHRNDSETFLGESGTREGRQGQTDDATQRSFQYCPAVHDR